MSFKMICWILVITIELGICSYIAWKGKHGFKVLQTVHAERRSVEAARQELLRKTATLQQDLINWHTDPFYREQYARKNLQMGKAHEEWYRY